MSTYLDSSVFLRRYLRESVDAPPPPELGDVGRPTACRIVQVEVLRRLGQLPSAVERSLGQALFRFEFDHCEVVEIDDALCTRAGDIAAEHAMRSLDAVHLAAAMLAECSEFVTGDRRQAAVARSLGMAVREC